MPAISASSNVGWMDIVGVARSRPFVRVMAALLVYNLPFAFACPYYQVFYLEVLHMPPAWIAVMQAGYFVVRIATAPALGRASDRLGPRRICLTMGLLYAGFLAVYPFGVSGRLWPFILAWAVVGLADASASVSLLSVLYGAVPNTSARPAYFLMYNVVMLGSFALGGAVAAPVLEAFKDYTLHVGRFTFGHFHLLYAFCTVLMLLCTFAALLLPGARTGDERS